MVFLSACSNNATSTMTAEEYSTYQTLLEHNEFRISQTYHDVQILSCKFAKACLGNDIDTVNNLLSDGTKADAMLNIFGDLEFIITKNISAVPDKDGQYVVSCEYLPNGKDSYSYLTLQVVKNGEALKVTSYAFEK